MALTAKQERFAQLLATSTLSQADAYRQVYDVSPTTLPRSVHQLASHLAADVNVASRVQELKDAAQKQLMDLQAWTLEKLVSEAEQNLQLARQGGYRSVAAANGALELIGRATGLLDRSRESPQQPITRVVVVLNHGPDAAGRPQITEAEYAILPAPEAGIPLPDDKAPSPTVPDNDNRNDATKSS